MLSSVAMQRASVVVLERDEHAVLVGLGRLGLVHLVRTKAGDETAPLEPPDRSADIARCDELLTRLETLRRRLGLDALDPSGAAIPELALAQVDENLKVFEARAGDLLARQQALQGDRHRIQTAVGQLEAYEGLELPMDQFAGASFLHFATGVMPAANLDDLRQRVGPNVVLLALPEQEGLSNVIAVSSRKAHYAMVEALEKSGFKHDTVTVPEGETPETLAAKTRGDVQHAERELAEVTGTVRAFACEAAGKLGDLNQIVRTERQILDAQRNFPRTEATVLISGWAPKPDVPKVRRDMERITGGRFLMTTADPDDVPVAEVPVLLKHPRILRPFASLVTGYGLPQYREFEPTILFAITFVLMFGMMFGDAGQGGVLVAGAIFLLVRGKTQQLRDAGLLVLLMGLSAVVFGIVYGSYFGIVSEHLAIWHDPLEGNPLELMTAAIGLGIAMVSLGLVLNVINKFRRREWLGGLLDKFGMAGAVFYWGTLGVAAKWAALKQSGLAMAALGAVFVVPLVAIALKEPLRVILSRRHGHAGHGSMGEACVEAVIEAFDTIIIYMSNTISFVRLAAYAMAHAAVLKASFSIARNLGEDWVPYLLGLSIIVLGNVIAIVLEGIISTVQAIRLEYYEFFGKFYSGSGLPFRPFRFSTKGS